MTADLFELPRGVLVDAADAKPARKRVDFFDLIATKFGAPTGWRWVSISKISDFNERDRARQFSELKGNIRSADRFKSGKRKGQLKNTAVPGTERTFIFSMAEFDSLKLDWEKSSGECSECEGNGDTVSYASASATRYRTCKRCGGSGKAVST